MATTNKQAGRKMRGVRENLGLTMREVHRRSTDIARSLRNHDYVVLPSRLFDIESKG